MTDPDAEGRRLLDFARASALAPTGFFWLDERGGPDRTQPVHTWVSTRMTHVFALAHLRGEPGAADLAAHGVRSLAGPLRDHEYGGWLTSIAEDGAPVDSTKTAYPHAFVVLAAGSATAAGIDGASALFDDALAVVRRHFLDGDGRVVDTYDRAFREPEPYRGANSSMHMVEALLVAGDVTGDQTCHETALGITDHLVGVARGYDHLLPEHFTEDWTPLPDYNLDSPADPFRPYGCTPGHLLEWARLLLHLEAALADPPGWLLPEARSLFSSAVDGAWHADGEPGFVYTVDWDRKPVVRSRMHWVHAEAIAATAALHRRTGEDAYRMWGTTFWEYVDQFLVDRAGGSWHHELDEHNRPSSETWRGKPDVYHAYQATLLPRLELAPSAAVQLAAR